MHLLSELPSLWWAALLVPAGALTWRYPSWVVPCAFLAGVVWISLRAELILRDKLPPPLEGQDIVVQGHVADIPEKTDFGLRFVFDVVRAEREGTVVRLPRRVQLSLRSDDSESMTEETAVPRAGESWRFRIRLKQPHGFQNPGGFDYEAYLFRQRIRAKGYIRLDMAPQRLAMPAPNAWRAAEYAIDSLRQRIGERIRLSLAGYEYAGIIVALVNGDNRGISDAQWGVLRRTGTLHLVAISGLHVSLIAGLAFFVARFLWSLPGFTVLRIPAPKFAAVCALTAATAYALLSGFVIPTQRALIMLTVALGAVLLRRGIAPSQLIALALFLVLLYDPLSVLATGFWLSFAAVAIIIFVVHKPAGSQSPWRKWGFLQFAIALGMLPLTLLFFQQVSLVAPIANVIAVPVFSLLVVPLSLAGATAHALFPSPVASLCFQIDGWILQVLWRVLNALSELKFAQWVQHQPALWTVACAVIGAALLLAPRGVPARWIGAIWMLPLFLARPAGPQTGEVWFTLLDVGQGLAAVVRTEHYVLVYDTGPRFSSSFDTGEAVVVPYLRAQGIRHIDTLLLSHGDNDHVGGAESVFRHLPVRTVLSDIAVGGLPTQPCRGGGQWIADEVAFEILGPPKEQELVQARRAGPLAAPARRARAGRGLKRPRDNDQSCVLMVRSSFGNILLPGDIEALGEYQLIKQYGSNLAATVLIAPHHGSKTSSSDQFLEAVRPAYVLIPAGYRNRFGHPHPNVAARYAAIGAARYDSATQGAIEMRLSAAGVELKAYRSAHRHYWYTH